jgi:hypothetical protein
MQAASDWFFVITANRVRATLCVDMCCQPEMAPRCQLNGKHDEFRVVQFSSELFLAIFHVEDFGVWLIAALVLLHYIFNGVS